MRDNVYCFNLLSFGVFLTIKMKKWEIDNA